MGRSNFTVDLPKSTHPKSKSEMEVNNIFVNYGITDFKQNPMSETDFIKIFLSGCPGNARKRSQWPAGKYIE